MADCFTFPHNDSFGGDLKAHMEYEHIAAQEAGGDAAYNKGRR